MEPLTLFTWGYWGWGTATDQLIQAVDAVEAARGYRPPLFVDIRISRSVRAPGFNGRAFELAVGASRYRWIDALGNVGILDGGSLRIKDPSAADTLLDIAKASASTRQRVLFFCSCEFPGVEGNGCHRVTVARLVLTAAKRRRILTQVVEWPGGEPLLEGFRLQLSPYALDKALRSGKTIPLEEPVRLAAMAGVPWCSVVDLRYQGGDDEEPFLRITGPARYKKGGWYLPIYEDILDNELSLKEIRRKITNLRRNSGFETQLP